MRFAARPAEPDPRPVIGLLVLSSDETLEQDMRRLFPPAAAVMHTARVANHGEISGASLAAMAETLPAAAASLPPTPDYAVIGYGCTSATAVLGSEGVAERVASGRASAHVTTPLDALLAACDALGVDRLARLSPYVAEVSEALRTALSEVGIETPVFGSFEEPDEPVVARIDAEATIEAAAHLGTDPGADAVFLSCTNLPTLDVIEPLEQALGKPVLSSNQVLAWHMARLAGAAIAVPGVLGQR